MTKAESERIRKLEEEIKRHEQRLDTQALTIIEKVIKRIDTLEKRLGLLEKAHNGLVESLQEIGEDDEEYAFLGLTKKRVKELRVEEKT